MDVLDKVINYKNEVVGHNVVITEKDLYLLNSMLIRHEKTCLSIEKDHIDEMKHLITEMLSDY